MFIVQFYYFYVLGHYIQRLRDVYFDTIRSIPCPFIKWHYRITLLIHRGKRVLLYLTQPDCGLAPPSYALSPLIRRRKNLLRSPNSLPHTVEEVKIKVI